MDRHERNASLQVVGISEALRFYLDIEKLKNLLRTGWLRRGMSADKVESVGCHTFGVVLMSDMLLAQFAPDLDRNKIMRMLLIHELGETHWFDAAPGDKVDPAVKHAEESASVKKFIGSTAAGSEYLLLWEEFEANETPEAHWAHQMDKLEFALQHTAYRLRGYFSAEAMPRNEATLKHPSLLAIFQELKRIGQGNVVPAAASAS